jgi:hypothetical protein
MQERKIMSSDAFMLPALPQIPASGLNGTDTRGPAAIESRPTGDSSDSRQSFSATLNQISERHPSGEPKATSSQTPAVTSRDPNPDSPSSQKMSKTSDCPHDHTEEVEAFLSEEGTPFFYPLSGFALMPSHLMNLSIAEDGSLAVEPPSGLTSKTDVVMPTDLIGLLYPQERQVDGEQLGIGPFEQLQFSVSPEAINGAFFDPLAFSAVPQEDGEGLHGKTARLFEFWQGMFASASTALGGALNGQPESSGINGNTTFHPLLQMLGITATAWGINPAAGSSHDPITERAHLARAFFDRLLTPSQPLQAEISEDGKIAAAGQEGRLSIWATEHSNSETLLEAQTRQMSENSQPLKIQAELKAAVDQPVNPNSVNEGITVKTPQELLEFKSTLQKSEMLPIHELGSKISQIDGDGKDSGLLFSQDQTGQHLARLENTAPSSEAASRSLLPQTLDQIVQRAVLSFNNGQHQIELHLKPDFLGHIRMQIISEGQQVAIKMVAELPFVKDMLENNLHQLKAELQSQGLDIDELEVSVAHDSHAERDVHQKAEAAKLQAGKTGADSDDGSSEASGQTKSRNSGHMVETAIDYFA